jgi:hypothetical protein
MGARKWVVALSVFALLTGQIPAEVARPIGVVLEADKAHAGSAEVRRGATVFSSEEFSTAPGGHLRVRLGGAQITLDGASSFSLIQQESRLLARLRTGTASVAWNDPSALEFTAHGVAIRPGSGLAHGAVTVSGPHELVVTSFSGSLAASYAGSTQLIPAGTSYKAMLSPAQEPEGAGRQGGIPLIVWVAVGAAVGVGLWLVLRETREPVSPAVP